MKNGFFDIRNLGGNYEKLLSSVEAGQKVSCFGMSLTERVLCGGCINGKVLYITSDYVSARRTYELFCETMGSSVALLPAAGDVLVFKHAQSKQENAMRIASLYSFASGETKILVTSCDALYSLCPKPNALKQAVLSIKKNKDYQIKNLVASLLAIGYSQQALVSSQGQFSVRGDILDVFAVGAENPFRIEFFDTLVEKVSEFSASSQKNLKEVSSCQILPCTNLLLSQAEKQQLKQKLEAAQGTASEEFKPTIENLLLKVEQDDYDFSMDFCFPLVEDSLCTIFDYLTQDSTVVIDECKMCYDAICGAGAELVSRKEQLIKSGESLSLNFGFAKKEEILESIKKYNNLAFLKVTTSNSFFSSQQVFTFKTAPVMRYTHSYNELAKAVETWLSNDFKVFICAGDQDGAKKIIKILSNREVYLDIKKHAFLSDRSSAILPLELSSGFILPQQNLVVLGTYDVLPRKNKDAKLLKNRNAVFSVPKVGDYVVHEVHGIGVCEGVTKLTGRFGTKDFVVVRYRGEDKLYVPIDQMDLLDRFSGAETPKRLSKIGGVEFSNVKEKVRSSIRQMAFDLLALYAQREGKSGFSYPQDDFLQLEFENAFPYTETEDQLSSISEIKKDMQSNKVMDRLLCGDVGFGKTEVAFRAAFKAVLASKQVAFLAPTTILSEQHMQTAKKRFESFGVRLAVLNRFRMPAEVKQILKDLKSGNIDIIFGTHRLLSSDVLFRDLGLIVLDEEQKFGVEDKEKLKLLKSNVDVLTLSATPIPRTLHMSLSGIRDVSIISSPPESRLPIQTYVTENLDSTIKDAIDRELSRGGQVFYVYNRVETIEKEAGKIKQLCPNARIVIGHGQMSPKTLEDVIYEFSSGRADVLVCTTIIENGIDISNANTLIVQNADRFGLSSLYQIRGRVGRGNKMAYAYFLYARDKVLTEEAYKRLEAISEFTEFGSGFKIAMRDLEIRGSGNVLGAEQHGHMQKVGYDLYCKMLSEEVSRLKQEEIEENREVAIKIDLDAYISDSYIQDSEARMTAYKNISLIKNEEDKERVEAELNDAFGAVPKETKNILEIALVKAMAKKLKMSEVWSTPQEIKFVFAEGSREIVSETMANAVFEFRDRASIDMGKIPSIRLRVGALSSVERLKVTKDFLICALKGKK